MMETYLRSWFTGLSGAGTVPTTTIVLAADAPIEAAATLHLAHVGWGVSQGAVQVCTGVTGPPTAAGEFTGSFEPGSELIFGDGTQVLIRNYGLADFEDFSIPTVLAICDDDDFSEFLRDADRAWHDGHFPGYLTHPAAAVANLPALGGSSAAAGPRHRLYVDGSGSVRTSPWGGELGAFDERIDTMVTRWLRRNAASPIGDATCLDSVISENDRSDALLERCYLPRFITAVHSLRGARVPGPDLWRVSGFGGRLTVEAPDVVDPVDAPVIAQFDSTYRAIDPVGGVVVELTFEQTHALETFLVSGEFTRSAAETIGLLKGRGVAWDWGLKAAGALVAA